jgi:hypothetical protein
MEIVGDSRRILTLRYGWTDQRGLVNGVNLGRGEVLPRAAFAIPNLLRR